MRYNANITALLIAALLVGCATKSSNDLQAFQAEDLNDQVKSGALVQMTNSVMVLIDASSSMGKTYLNSEDYSGIKLDVEKNLLNKFNKTIPDISLRSGLRSFGLGSCTNWSETYLNQSVQKHSEADFESAISTLTCASGGTPLAEALVAAKLDLASMSSNFALIILSDGMDDTNPLPVAEALKARYADKLCIHTIWVGNESDRLGQESLNMIADASGCGVATDAATISSASGMSQFVKTVFFNSDVPMQLDDDADGVANVTDKCPETPKGAIVDKDGCWAFHEVLFEFDSDTVQPVFESLIKNATDVLYFNPGLTIEIQGHTDNYGGDVYNRNLSERRALAVKNELVGRGIDGKRMTVIGFGASQPAESNETDEGRGYNRRVVFERTDTK